MIDYNEACNNAATAQGLDPIMEALAAAEIDHDLWQSGGFCMIVIVSMPDNTQIWLTDGPDWGGPEGQAFYTTGHICHRSDDDYDNCPACHSHDEGGESPSNVTDGFAAYADLAELINRLRG